MQKPIWLVCNTLAEGCRVASDIRDCPCGAQVRISALMTLWWTRVSWPCHCLTGRLVTIHDPEIDELTRLGRLAEGWRVIAEMNSALSESTRDI
jgi:hypothetical protein